ncbi:hypothetical protein BC940DRAFT_136617 [Gongronella butleri]|nr:hypothetical protein BC940DRAFT_136617 [Gongronella butleri]
MAANCRPCFCRIQCISWHLQTRTEKFTQCVQQDDLAMLEQLLFQDMTLQEWRLWLMMRTTVGSQSVVWPPSLHECLVAFTTIHRKPPKAKKRKDNDDECKKGENAAGTTPCFPKKQKPVAPNILTVGAKALSKHWHRDRQTSFWGICTGSETAKNQHANQCLLNILFNAVWINLHSLPHDHLVYEIREPNGYGVRWSTSALDKQWMFRGFLEPQMEDGHDRGWIH